MNLNLASALKKFATLALVLATGAATLSAQHSIKMTFSGTSENSANNLQQPDTSNDEDVFAGSGSLGSFHLRSVRAISNSPSSSSTCAGANQLHFSELSGGGVFRFDDGSLLYVNQTQGDDCIDFTANDAKCTLVLQITGGTGRFRNASGTLTLSETVLTVLSDALGNPVLFAATGQISGRVAGVIEVQDRVGGRIE